jgi:transcriptional regulator EpsA
MTDARLDPTERELLPDVVEASFRVVERHHFFQWTQGIFQALVPHEILICGVDDGAADGLSMQHFSGTRYFRDEHFTAVAQPRAGLFARMISEWQAADQPLVLGPGNARANGNTELLEIVERNELRNVAAHGVRAGPKRIAGFYSFSRIPPDALGGHIAYVAQILVPHLHATYLRVLARESRTSGGATRGGRAITEREAEILGWIKQGKTNADIAEILALSPWTVKNHVQTILKKLAAQTRSHAVARGISLGILESGD